MSTKASEEEVSDTSPPLTLPSIQARIRQLLSRLPTKDETESLDANRVPELEAWCRRVRGVLRQYNLVLNFLSVATYQWEPDRPGHTGQVGLYKIVFWSVSVFFVSLAVVGTIV
jgi:hypothetical protein